MEYKQYKLSGSVSYFWVKNFQYIQENTFVTLDSSVEGWWWRREGVAQWSCGTMGIAEHARQNRSAPKM